MAELAEHVIDTARGTRGDWWAGCRCGWMDWGYEWHEDARQAAAKHFRSTAQNDPERQS